MVSPVDLIKQEAFEQVRSVAPNAAGKVFKNIQLNLGPQHPATHGTLRFKMELNGETIVKVDPEIGFLHTGFEKLGEYRTYNQFIVVTDRANYLSPICNNIGFAVACEELFEIEVPPRGQYVRVAMAELARIADHIVCVGLQSMDLGAFSTMLWTFIEREKVYDIIEAVTGARLTTSWTRVGGIFRDVPSNFSELIEGFIKQLPPILDEIEMMLSRNKIFMDRTVGVGVVPSDVARSFGITGPILRASGVPYDVRKNRPYLCYGDLDFKIPVRTEGDVYARYLVRMAEMRESLKIIRQCLEKMPDGPVSSVDHKVTLPSKDQVYHDMESLIHQFKLTMPGHGISGEPGEIYSCTEATCGELGFYLVCDGTGVPYRVRIRPPSFYNLQSMPYQTTGGMISDAVAVLSSLHVIAGELDR